MKYLKNQTTLLEIWIEFERMKANKKDVTNYKIILIDKQ